jgi:hypothetical protein
MSLAKTAPSPRSTVRRPNYPVVLAASAMLVLAACGGKVEGDGSDGEAAGSAGRGPVPMPTGAGSGGSYDPGTGGTVDTGGTGGYSGMPSGAGAGGSFETGGSGGQDFDAGTPQTDAGVVVPEYAAIMNDPCVSSCVANNAQSWGVLLGTLAPCICAPGACDQVCADTVCAHGPQGASKSCGGCALVAGDECTDQLIACLSNPSCDAVVQCLMGCQL